MSKDVKAMRNIHMDPDTRALSAQMYHMLIMPGGCAEAGLDESEPRTTGRQCALLQELFHYGFLVDPRAAFDEFEAASPVQCVVKREDVRKLEGMVQKGTKDDALKTHLVLHASRLSNSQVVRGEVRSVLITRQALVQGPMPMDIGALGA